MYTSSMIIVPVLAALIGIIALYKGGGGSTPVHRAAAIAGAIVVLCISALPFIALAAVGSLAGTESPYEPVFLGYAFAAVLSTLTALACTLRLMRPRPGRRAAA